MPRAGSHYHGLRVGEVPKRHPKYQLPLHVGVLRGGDLAVITMELVNERESKPRRTAVPGADLQSLVRRR